MVNSVGKKLQQARLSKQLSIEEAARVTRIRPDKLIDLEEDNYSNFPSMSYAKGFLLLYARFLGVDVREFADTLHAPNPVSSDDYEYLNAAAAGPRPRPPAVPITLAPRRERDASCPSSCSRSSPGPLSSPFTWSSPRAPRASEDIADKEDTSCFAGRIRPPSRP